MTGEVIKSFLVGLGFDVDDSSLAKFNKAIATATVRVTALYAAIKVAAAGIFFSISKISESFEELGYEYKIIAPAINKALILRQALLQTYKAAGINLKQAIQDSLKFNLSLTKTKYALDAIYKSVGAKFLPLLTKQLDLFRGRLFANLPRIQAALEKFVSFIFKAFEVTNILGGRLWSILGRVYDFFVKLDEVTGGWSTKILAMVAAWQLLNLSFLASPLGLVLTGLLAILALYDDFMTFEEGGQSLIDWGHGFGKVLAEAAKFAKSAFESLFNWLAQVIPPIFGKLQDFMGWISSKLDKLSSFTPPAWLTNWIAGNEQGLHPVVNPGVTGQQPLFNPAQNSSQKISQETNILVQGSADATSTGKAVASEQQRVNFDMTRNMKGAVR